MHLRKLSKSAISAPQGVTPLPIVIAKAFAFGIRCPGTDGAVQIGELFDAPLFHWHIGVPP
jgi:hypothetical protein